MSGRRWCAAVGLAAGLGLASPVLGQQIELDPDAALDTEVETPGPAEAAPVAEAEAAAEAAAEAPALLPAPRRQTGANARAAQAVVRQRPPSSFVLRDIRFSGPSSYLDAATLDRAEAALVGRRYPLQRIGIIGQTLSRLYADREIFTAQAIVTDLDIATGVVTVDLLEARLGAVRGPSAGGLSADYLRYRLGLGAGDLADSRIINERLLRLFVTDGLAVAADFAPGAAPGATDLTLSPVEPPVPRGSVTLDNFGSSSLGEERLSLAYTIPNLTGWNDPLTISSTLREGSVSGSLSYGRVVTRDGGRIGFSITATQSESLDDPPTEGRFREATLSYAHPVVAEPDRQLTLRAALTAFEEGTTFLGEDILDQSAREIALTVEAGRVTEERTFAGSATLQVGRYDDGVLGRDVDYRIASASATLTQTLGQDMLLAATAFGQHALEGPVPGARTLGVTDPGAVRGYPAGLSSGDSGYVIRLQLEKATPLRLGTEDLPVPVRPFVFFDIGQAFDSTDVGLGRARSIGIGAAFAIGDTVFGDVYVAKPLETDIVGWTDPDDGPVFGLSLTATF